MKKIVKVSQITLTYGIVFALLEQITFNNPIKSCNKILFQTNLELNWAKWYLCCQKHEKINLFEKLWKFWYIVKYMKYDNYRPIFLLSILKVLMVRLDLTFWSMFYDFCNKAHGEKILAFLSNFLLSSRKVRIFGS
jgi:hypothetical protein